MVETEVDGLVITPHGGGVQEIETDIPATLIGDIHIRVEYIRSPCRDARLGGVLPVNGVPGILGDSIARDVPFGTEHTIQQHFYLLAARPRILAARPGLQLIYLSRHTQRILAVRQGRGHARLLIVAGGE